MRHATLCFLVKEHEGKITETLLGKKQLRLGVGKWNGAGGHVEEGESPDTANIRETREELGVRPLYPRKVAEVAFYWPEKPENEQCVHVYLATRWDGDPKESDELADLRWFPASGIPLKDMWEADRLWLSRVLAGELVYAWFTYHADGRLAHKNVEAVPGFCPKCHSPLRRTADRGREMDGGEYEWYHAVECARRGRGCDYLERTEDYPTARRGN